MKTFFTSLTFLLFVLVGSTGAQDLRNVKLRLPGQDVITDVVVEVRGQRVFIDDDIVVCDLRALEEAQTQGPDGAYVDISSRRWKDNTIYYQLSRSHREYSNIIKAMQHIERETHLKFEERTGQGNYIKFIEEAGTCWSYVGMKGGMQELNLGGTCGFGAAVHELCHAAGMYHEQSRADRDSYVKIQWSNIETGKEHNFQTYIQKGLSGKDYGSYDYGSIMHYGSRAFSTNGLKTIELRMPPAKSGTVIGQRDGLSDEDVATLNNLYPGTKVNLELYAPLEVQPRPLCHGEAAQVHLDCVNRGSGTLSGFFAVDLHEYSTGDFVAELGRTGDLTLPSNHHFTNGLNVHATTINVREDDYLLAVWFWDYHQGEWIYVDDGEYENAIAVEVTDCSQHYLNLNPDRASIVSEETYYSFEVASDDFWTMESSVTWIKYTMPIANYQSAAVYCEKNSGPERTALIHVVSDHGLKKTFTLVQEAFVATLSVDTKDIHADSRAGTYKFSIASNTDWKIDVGKSWIAVNKPSGRGNAEVSINVSANNTRFQRKGEVSIHGAGKSYVLYITQAALGTTSTRSLPNGITKARAFPNPVHDQLHLELEGPVVGPMKVECYSLNGGLRWAQDVSKSGYELYNSLKVDDLPVGPYILKLITPTGVWTQSFVKQSLCGVKNVGSPQLLCVVDGTLAFPFHQKIIAANKIKTTSPESHSHGFSSLVMGLISPTAVKAAQ